LVFGRHWIFAGVEPEIPEPGDFFTIEIGDHSIIIARHDDRGVHAYHNVCRHRGARLLAAGRGTMGNLVCPYHQWTYDLRGELIHNQHMGEGFERCRFNLKPVHLQNLAGLLFICLAETPAPGFAALRAAAQPYIAPHGLAHTKIAFQKDIIEAGNWKLTMENNRECYHCVANHPELIVPLPEYGFGYQPSPDNRARVKDFEDLLTREHLRWEACGLPSTEIDRLEDPSGFRIVRLPIARAGESQTLDTRIASRKLLVAGARADLGGLSFWTQPNSWHHFMSDHIVSFSVLPVSPDQTLVRTRWLVHEDAREGVDYDLQRLTEVWLATNDQDRALVEIAHRGIRSPAYQPGPYSPFTEGLVDKFCNWYLARLSEDLGANPDVKSSPRATSSSAIVDQRARIVEASPAATSDTRVFSVTFSQAGRTVPCRADQTILTAAEAAGLPLPFSCRDGRCGTCRSRLICGSVDMKHAGGIRQRQIDQGDILVCCSRPLTDLVIEKIAGPRATLAET